MVDHDHVGFLRPQPRARHETLTRKLAVFAEAIARGARHRRPHGAVFGNAAYLIDVARAGLIQKDADAPEVLDGFARGQRDLAPLAGCDAVAAQVVGPPL